MTPITQQLIKKPAIYSMILLFSRSPLVHIFFSLCDRVVFAKVLLYIKKLNKRQRTCGTCPGSKERVAKQVSEM